ncbi:FGGY-family carbohydrate kinase [Duganella callida]|uniref:L-fuculose kinase n=1 Tax=Duganella callida TaxID=2561932 RepID=A0A4Y9SVC3_9BURK|nr:FGGY family carbohydrate kinase [Duganella callida]TFW29289.1 L-fuculose kinase [Duganella callida]
MTADATVVLDIGKTNVKLSLLDRAGAVLDERRMANAVLHDAPYPHYDTDRMWHWMLDAMRAFAGMAQVDAIVPVTHGATAALVDDAGLVLPVLDYEFEPPASQSDYRALRPGYEATRSPLLPAGLNLGRQLVWLAQSHPAEFQRARHILMYPQYWAWRLSGMAASEVTSLGCHTDLWQPARKQYSSLVGRMGWSALFPPLRDAWAVLGEIKPELAEQTGLPPQCKIICGIHDSNASLLRHIQTAADRQPLSVLSTGTWVIAAAIGMPLDGLREEADMLANSNALGQPVACMRFMGGREFAELAGPDAVVCSVADLQRLIEQGTMALPCFSAAGGPFAGRAGSTTGPAPQSPQERYALATLYCVLMSDHCLTALGAAGAVVVEGSYTGNPHFGPLLAALRPRQTIFCSDDTAGTTCGGWMLHHWGERPVGANTLCAPADLRGWDEYRKRWLALV